MFPIISYGLEKAMKMKDMDKRGRYFDVDTVLNFGRNKGLTIEDVYNDDPDYLIWMYENFEDTEWSDEAEALVTQAYDRDYEYSYSGGYEGGHDLLDYGVDNPDDIFL